MCIVQHNNDSKHTFNATKLHAMEVFMLSILKSSSASSKNLHCEKTRRS